MSFFKPPRSRPRTSSLSAIITTKSPAAARLLGFSLSLSVLVGVGCADSAGSASSSTPSSAAALDRPAPALVAEDLGGRPVSLAALTGKVVVVDFWASWCEPCEEAMPVLEQLARAHASDLVVIGVSVDDRAEDARAFIDRVGVSFTVIHDRDHGIAEAWVPPKMPTTYVIDQTGVVVAVEGGYGPGAAGRLQAQVEALLSD